MEFDKIINRKGTGCTKYDGMAECYGREDLMPMWIADMDFEVCSEIYDALRARLDHKIYGYHVPPASYWQSIIDWCGHRHNFHFTREEVTYIPGIVRGIGYAINFFTQKSDKILIQPPVYHPFRQVIEGNERVVVKNHLIDNGTTMVMDLDKLEEIIRTERPKMMILCNPHNPGGIIWDRETLAKVADICYDNHVLVISDEIHGDLELFGNRYTPFATVSEKAAKISIVFGAPSKTFNIPGLVSSWCVIKNPEIRESFFNWLTVNQWNEPTLFLTVATEAAYTKGEAWLGRALAYIEDNIRFAEDFIAKNLPEIRVMRPQASFLLWLDCTNTHLKGKKLCELFINHAHLALNDGEMFGDGGECHMRFNVGCPRKTLEEALQHLVDAFDEEGIHKKQK